MVDVGDDCDVPEVFAAGHTTTHGSDYRTAASPSSAFASAKKSGIGCTFGPSSSNFGPSDVTAST